LSLAILVVLSAVMTRSFVEPHGIVSGRSILRSIAVAMQLPDESGCGASVPFMGRLGQLKIGIRLAFFAEALGRICRLWSCARRQFDLARTES
jgi:hypothetical protein